MAQEDTVGTEQSQGTQSNPRPRPPSPLLSLARDETMKSGEPSTPLQQTNTAQADIPAAEGGLSSSQQAEPPASSQTDVSSGDASASQPSSTRPPKRQRRDPDAQGRGKRMFGLLNATLGKAKRESEARGDQVSQTRGHEVQPIMLSISSCQFPGQTSSRD